MDILLLGGTGAMGTSLKDILAKRGDQVYITSRRNRNPEENVHYITGNAHNVDFMSKVLNKKYDAIVDFMVYNSTEFSGKLEILLDATNQYFFTSSCRVFSDVDTIITEDTPRLLDVCKNVNYLNTDEYALAKARSENFLFENSKKNWTIIRPYITYNVERLQLGTFEKDMWLYRAMHGRSIVLPKDVAGCQTTMTYGEDVARSIAALIGNQKALGEAFNLTGTEHMTWADVLDIYTGVLENKFGSKPKVYMPEDSSEISKIVDNSAQFYYDRLYNRIFDNSKLLSAIGNEFEFVSMKDGLSRCLTEFMENPKWIGKPNPKLEGFVNRQTNDKMLSGEINGAKNKTKYWGWRYIPKVMKLLKKKQ